MKRLLLVIVAIPILIGCETASQKEREFEKSLPQADLIVLEKIVESYNNLLESKYNGDPKQLFSAISSGQPILNEAREPQYCELINLLSSSTLEYKSRNVKYDSVYLADDGSIKKVRKENDSTNYKLVLDEDFIVLPPGRTIEEEVERIREEGYWEFVSESSFISALKSIADGNTDLEQYIDRKENVGYVDTKSMARSLMEDDISDDNYFVKRIVALELFINKVKIEYGC